MFIVQPQYPLTDYLSAQYIISIGQTYANSVALICEETSNRPYKWNESTEPIPNAFTIIIIIILFFFGPLAQSRRREY